MSLGIGMKVNPVGSGKICHIFYLGKLQSDPVKYLTGFTVVDFTAVITDQIHAFIMEIQCILGIFDIIDIPAGTENEFVSGIRPLCQDFFGIIGNLLFVV